MLKKKPKIIRSYICGGLPEPRKERDKLYTIMERLLEELSFEAPEMKMGSVEINAAYVTQRLDEISQDEDLSKFIL